MNNENLINLSLSKGSISDLDALFPLFLHDYASEEKDINFFQNLMGRQKYQLFFAQDSSINKDIGYAFFFESLEEKTLWLDYISIFPEYQNKGYGSKFIKEIMKKYKDFKGIFFEIDYPHSEDDKVNHYRKIEFYKRFGAQKFPFKYQYPSDGKIVTMDLYFQPITSPEVLKKETIIKTLQDIFRYFYGHENETELILSHFQTIVQDCPVHNFKK